MKNKNLQKEVDKMLGSSGMCHRDRHVVGLLIAEIASLEARLARRKAFVPPTEQEAVEFGRAIGLSEDQSRHFCDHFGSNGWKVGGKAPMKNWKLAMRNWKRMRKRFEPDAQPGDYRMRNARRV